MSRTTVYVLFAEAIWGDRHEIIGGFTNRPALENAALERRALADIRRNDRLTAEKWRDGRLVDSSQLPRP